MRKDEVITELAKERVVEEMVANITHSKDCPRPEPKDLAQMVYCILLEYDERVILDLWEKGEIRFFIARIIINQFRSKKSEFFKLYHKEQQKWLDLSAAELENLVSDEE